MRNFTYYRPARILSLNSTYCFIVGPRGNGKTYGFKKKSIKDALRYGHEFIYLRRYKPEIQAAAPTFFADIQHEFPSWIFRVRGKYLEAAIRSKDTTDAADKNLKWKIIGYALALSVSTSYKSVSFHDVRNVIFDEFITKNKTPGYLPSEMVAFNEFYSTVDRYQGRARVYFIANSVSVMNPYFIALNIEPDKITKAISAHNVDPVTHRPFVAVEIIGKTDFTSEVMETEFGRFIAATDPEYAAYAVDNEFEDGHDQLVSAKTADSQYLFTIETIRHGRMHVWHDYKERQYFVTTKGPRVTKIYTLDRNKMDEGKVFVTYSDEPLKNLRRYYNTARILFDRPATRNAFAEIMDKK